MLEQVKRFAVIATIAILFTVLAFSISDLIKEEPKYDDFCGTENYNKYPDVPREVNVPNDCPDETVPEDKFIRECTDDGGIVRYNYSDGGCVEGFTCSTCHKDYDKAREDHSSVMFIIVSLIGLVGIFSGLYLKAKEEIMEWILSGFILGGLASIFVATIIHFGNMDRVVRPIVIIAEIVLVVWVTIKTKKNIEKKGTKHTKKK